MLEKDRSLTMHDENLQSIMTEMLKTTNNLNPTFMNEFFPKGSADYNLTNASTFTVPIVFTVLKRSDIEGSVFNTHFHRKSKMQILRNDSRIR